MAKYKSSSTSKVDQANQVSLRDSRTGEVKTSVFTKDTQFGASNYTTNPVLKTYGDFLAYGGISGSLTRLTDGTSYLAAGSGVIISSESNGQITITAGSPLSANPLTMGSGFSPYNTAYDGTSTQSVSVLAETNKGIGVSSAGLKLYPGNLASTTSATTSWELIVADGNNVYRETINNVLNLGISATITLANAVTFGNGIEDSAGGASSYNNSVAVTLAAKIESSKGLAVSAAGIKIDPSTLTLATVATGDKVFIGDVNDADNVKYVTAQSIANLATVGTLTNPITVGNGLSPNGDTFDGSVAKTFAVAAADSTVIVNSSGVAVAKVPNALTDGNGIANFSYDGASTATISAEVVANGGLALDSSGIKLDISNLPGISPSTGDSLAFYDQSTSQCATVTIQSFKEDFIQPPIDALKTTDNTWTGKNTFEVSPTAGLTGSLQEVSSGTPYLVGGSNVTVSYNTPADGQITITAVGGGGSVPSSAPVITWQADAALTDERILTASSGFSVVNNGVDKVTLTTDPQKVPYHLSQSHESLHPLTIPGIQFSDNSYAYNKTDVYLNGALMLSGAVEDYYLQGDSSSVTFTFALEKTDSLLFKLN
jgi:hypothetical protein